MRGLVLFAASVALLAAVAGWIVYKRSAPTSGIVGEWELRFLDSMPKSTLPPGMEPNWSITFHSDGTFSEHMENHVMMDMVSDGKGTYKLTGNTVSLKGSSTTYMDDGYRKGTHTLPVDRTLQIEGDKLVMEEDPRRKGSPVPEAAFFRVGSPTQRPLVPPRVESTEEAKELIKKVEQKYTSLESYADEGTLKSSGHGFMFSDARFITRYSKPKKFLFRIDAYENGKPYQANAVWSDGRKSWVYEGMDGAMGERGIADGLATYSPTWGFETMLVPALLMPWEFVDSPLREPSQSAKLDEDEVLDGKDCFVLKLTNSRSAEVTFWIDKKSLLILKAHDGVADATVAYAPKTPVTFHPGDFLFKQPK